MKKRFTEEKIIAILREAESPEVEICALVRRHNVTEQIFYRWRNKCSGMYVAPSKRAYRRNEQGLRYTSPTPI